MKTNITVTYGINVGCKWQTVRCKEISEGKRWLRARVVKESALKMLSSEMNIERVREWENKSLFNGQNCMGQGGKLDRIVRAYWGPVTVSSEIFSSKFPPPKCL